MWENDGSKFSSFSEYILMKRGGFQIRLSTALIASLLASVLLGANLTRRVELLPLGLSIGRGEASVPVQAFYSRSIHGWPYAWDADDGKQNLQIGRNAAVAGGLLLLTMGLCELWVRRRERNTDVSRTMEPLIAGLSLSFVTGVAALGAGAAMLWQNSVLIQDGPFAVRGWPFQFHSFVRAEAVLTRDDLQQWDLVNDYSLLLLAANVVCCGALIGAIFFVSRVYRQWRLKD
jgi:hypothetical protein